MDTPYEACLPIFLNPLEYENPSEYDAVELQENMATSIYHLGLKTTAYIGRCIEEDAQLVEAQKSDILASLDTFVSHEKEKRVLKKLFDEWKLFFIDHYPTMLEVKTFELEDELEDEYDPETGKLLRSRPRKIKNALGFQVFAELCRLYYLLQRPILIQPVYESEIVSLHNTKHDSWISIYQSFDNSSIYEKDEEADAQVEEGLTKVKDLWEKPVVEYKQSEFVLVVLFMTQQLNHLKMECVNEYKRIFNHLMIRCSTLIHQVYSEQDDVLDEPDMFTIIDKPDQGKNLLVANRDFYAFVCFYMGEILRRLYYYDIHSKNNAMKKLDKKKVPYKEYAKQVEEWVHKIIVEDTPEEAFKDLYIETCNESYTFAGDFEWFKYKWPLRSQGVAANLAAMRPHLYRPFFSEERAKKHLVLSNMHTSYTSRLYLLHALSGYFHAKTGSSELKWYQGIIIKANEILSSAYELESNQAPFIVQILSSFWAYDQGRVYMTDNIYETLAIWFWLLKNRYSSTLYDLHFHAFVQLAIEGLGAKKKDQKKQVSTSKRSAQFRI